MSAPSTMHAIKSQSAGVAKLVPDAPVPSLSSRQDYVLAKVNAIALNPTDWKHIDQLPSANSTVGCDFAGTVVEVGSQVTKSLKPGDRIAGMAHGTNALQTEDGSFGEYAAVLGDVQMLTPANMSNEEAATLGVGVATVGQGMYQALQLPWPGEQPGNNTPLLVYGGSTATGLFAIQFARLSGLRVVTTCSPRNFDLVKQLGAEEAFDYNDPECGAKIRAHTGDALQYVFDCVSEGDSPRISCEALSSSGGGKYTALLPVKEFPRSDVNNLGRTLAYTSLGKPLRFRGTDVPAKPEDLEFAKKWWAAAEKWFAEGKIKAIPFKVDEGGKGLEGAFEGLDLLRKGKVSGTKLVYKVT